MIALPKALLYVVLLTGELAGALVAADRYVIGRPATAVTSATPAPPPQPGVAVTSAPPPEPRPPQPVVDGWQKFKFGMTPAQINAQRLCAEKLVKIVSVEPEGPESDAFPCFPRGSGQLTFLRFIGGRLAQVHYARTYTAMENLAKDSGAEHIALTKKYGDWSSDGVSRSKEEAGQRTLEFFYGDLKLLQHIFADGAVRIIMKRNERFATLSVHFIDPEAYRTGKSWAGR